MSPLAESNNSELKHLNADICIATENTSAVSALWDLEGLGYKKYRDLNIGKYNSVGYLAGESVEWLLSQTVEETIQESLSTSDLPPYISSNFEKLNTKFRREITNPNLNSFFSLKDIESQFLKSSSKIAEIDFLDGIVEITKNESIKYTLIFPENKILMISQPLGAQNENYIDNEEIVYSFFINRELISTNAMELSTFVEGFNRYLQM